MTTHANDSVFASDRDREVVCNQLSAAAGEGRITADEHENLVTLALASRKRGELRRLIDELPNPKLPELPQPAVRPNKAKVISYQTVECFFWTILLLGLLTSPLWFWLAFRTGQDISSNPIPANPTPAASITDLQDRAFVQVMIDFHNSSNPQPPDYATPTDVDETAVLDIAHKLRNPATDVRQQFLLIMDSNAYKGLTVREKYHAGKMALSVWRAGDEAAWVAMGKDQRYG